MPTHRHHGKKIRLSLARSLLSSTYFHAIIHVLDLRDHILALPCLVSYLVVSLLAYVVCLASRLVNWAFFKFLKQGIATLTYAKTSKAQFTNRLAKQTTQAYKDTTRYETKQGRAKL